MYKTWAFSWEPEVTDAFFTTSCSQHNKSGRRIRLKKWKVIFILILRSKKDLSTSCSNFTWGRVDLGELQTSCLKGFIPYSFLIKKMYQLLLQSSLLIRQYEITVFFILYQPSSVIPAYESHYFSSIKKPKPSYLTHKFQPGKFLITSEKKFKTSIYNRMLPTEQQRHSSLCRNQMHPAYTKSLL